MLMQFFKSHWKKQTKKNFNKTAGKYLLAERVLYFCGAYEMSMYLRQRFKHEMIFTLSSS